MKNSIKHHLSLCLRSPWKLLQDFENTRQESASGNYLFNELPILIAVSCLSPVNTHILISAFSRVAMVSGTPAWSRSSMAVAPSSSRFWIEKQLQLKMWKHVSGMNDNTPHKGKAVKSSEFLPLTSSAWNLCLQIINDRHVWHFQTIHKARAPAPHTHAGQHSSSTSGYPGIMRWRPSGSRALGQVTLGTLTGLSPPAHFTDKQGTVVQLTPEKKWFSDQQANDVLSAHC